VEGKNPSLENENATKNTPFKALSWNFLKVPEHHERHFDKVSRSSSNTMILAPAWDPKKEWEPGTSYSLVVAAKPDTYKWLMGTKLPSESSPKNKWLEEASDQDLELATDFLSLTVRALADLLVLNDDPIEMVKNHLESSEEDDPANQLEAVAKKLEEVLFSVENGVDTSDLFPTQSESTKTKGKTKKSKTKERVENLQSKVDRLMSLRRKFMEAKEVIVPVKKANIKDGKAKILKVNLGLYFEGKSHFIPDPYLWALKAGSAWGGYNSQKSLMACDVYGPFCSDTFDDSDDMSQDPPVEITIMEGFENINRNSDEISAAGSSMSSISNCKTDSDRDGKPVAVVTPS